MTKLSHLTTKEYQDDQELAFDMAEDYAVLAVSDPELIPLYKYWHKQAQSYESSGWKKVNGMTQHAKILKHLDKAGSITVREGLIEYSIASLTKRIQELRELGYAIVSHPKVHPVTGQRYVRYTL